MPNAALIIQWLAASFSSGWNIIIHLAVLKPGTTIVLFGNVNITPVHRIKE